MRFALLLLVLRVAAVTAQTRLPAGVHRFEATGVFQGTPMRTWKSELDLRDTASAGAVVIRDRSVYENPPATFLNTTIVARDGRTFTSASWVNNGREVSECHLSLTADSVRGRLVIGNMLTRSVVLKPLALRGDATPDFALAGVLTMRTLSDGDTVQLSVVRCLPGWEAGAIQIIAARATVKSGSAPRAAGAPDEAVWIVRGAADYPFTATIAKNDRQLFGYTIPQGTVGMETRAYRGTVK